MNHAAAETGLVDQLEVHTHIVGEGLGRRGDLGNGKRLRHVEKSRSR
jgi:hypothetical protein